MISKLRFLFRTAVVAMVVLGFQQVNAQTTPQFYNGNSGTGNSIPFNMGGTAYNRLQSNFAPGLFNSSGATGTPAYQGMITTVYIYFPSVGSATTTYNNFTISLGQVNGTNAGFVSSTYYTNLTLAYTSSAFQFTGITANAWYPITLQTPFLYDPSQALVVETNYTNGVTSGHSIANITTTGVSTRLYGDATATVGTLSANQMCFGFDLVPSGPCVVPPTPGIASASKSNPCFGQPINLLLTGNSYGTGQTYQWQSSSTTTGPWTNQGSAQTAAAYVGMLPPVGTTYYRCLVSCGSSLDSSTFDTVTVPSPFPGNTYTINPAIPASSTNFQSIGAAVSAISCGISGNVIFNLAPNTTFNEQITLPATIGANASQTVTFNGNGDTLTWAGNSASPWTLGLDGADYITFNDLVVRGTDATYALVAHLWNQSDNNTFNNCTFLAPANGTSSIHSPFSVSGSSTSATTSGSSGSYNTLDSCTMFSGYYNTVFVGTNATNQGNGNRVLNSKMTDFYFYGTYMLYQDSLELTNNIVERPTRSTISSFYGLYVSTGCTNALVQQNRVRNMCGGNPNYAATVYGIYCTASASVGNENKFYNNIVSNFNNNAGVYGLYLTGTYNKSYFNTITIDNTSANSTSTTYGIYASGTAGVDIMNNIVSITQGGAGTKYCMYFTGAGKTSNYNNLFMGSTTGTNNIGYYSSAFASFAAWQGANSNAWDQNSANQDPMFVSPNTGNFIPMNALLDNLGTPIVAVSNDINNVTRSLTTPDMGAIEFSIFGCTGTPNAGTVGGPTAIICPNTSFTLNLSGFTIASGTTVQWQSSPAGMNAWSDISGATNYSYTESLGVALNTDYRAYMVCTLSSAADTSNVKTINVAPIFPGGTYTVNSAVATGGTNFNNFTDAMSYMGCGIGGPVVINVAPGSGPYNEPLHIPNTIGTNSTNTLTINGNGATLQYSPSASYTGILMINGADYIKIDSLTFKSLSSQYGFGAILYNACDYDTITRCTFDLTNVSTTSSTDCGWLRISTTPSTTSNTLSGATNSYFGDNQFLGNTGTGGAYYGIYAYGPNNNNVYINNLMSNFYYYGVYDYYGNNVSYINNKLTRQTKLSSAAGGYYGMYFSNMTNGAQIVNNRVEYLGGATSNSSYTYPFNIFTANGSSATPVLIANNIISNHTASPYYGMRISGGSYLNIYHNTISIDDAVSYTNANYGLYILSSPSNSEVKNNLISILGGGTSSKYGLYYSSLPTSSDNNNVYVNSSQSGTQYFGYSGGNQASLAAWQTATSKDASSHSIPAMFVATTNLKPTNGGLDNMGTPLLNVPYDIDSVLRNGSTPDIGAYEFSIATCSGTPNAGVAFGPTNACPSQSFNVNDSAFSIGVGITIQWQDSSSVSGAWADILGATSTSYTVTAGITVPTSYRMIITCTNSFLMDTSNVLNIGVNPFFSCYCASNATNTADEEILGFTLGSLTTTSTCSTTGCSSGSMMNQYSNYAGCTTVPIINRGDTVSFALNLGYCGTFAYSNVATIYIDYNQNGLYTDAGEAVYTKPYGAVTITGQVFVDSFVVPITANTGNTGMRIVYVESSLSNPCGTYGWGETEDYVVNIDYPLAIKLSDISAINQGAKNRVDWSTEAELKGDVFELERSMDGVNYETIYVTDAKGAASRYSYTDNSPYAGVNYYRLKLKQTDGTQAYSKVVTATVSGSVFAVQAFPNPVANELTVKVNGMMAADATVQLTDLTGKVITTVQLSGATTTIEMKGLANGVYLVKYTDANHTQTIRVTKQ